MLERLLAKYVLAEVLLMPTMHLNWPKRINSFQITIGSYEFEEIVRINS